jgi:hypothetical protein
MEELSLPLVRIFIMTDKAIKARDELAAWLKKYQPDFDMDYSGCYYPDDRGSTNISVDGAIIATSSGYSLKIES